jgi:Fe-S-cluster-containing dehydrogenase component
MPPLSGPHGLPQAAQWRTLLEDPARMAREYPALAPVLSQPHSRRRVLKLMAASMALGGLGGCDPSEPDGLLIPAPVAAPGIVAGRPNVYATTSFAGGSALGITVSHQMGRPIKVEGNPDHPASLGATDALAQALILDFYDPDRAGGVLRSGEPADRQDLLLALASLRGQLAATHGSGLRILHAGTTSPTLGAALDAVLQHYPEARLHRWDAVSRESVRSGAAAYGRPVDIVPRVAAADVILALDSDLISTGPGWVRHARDFASRRNPARPATGQAAMSRVYAAEPSPTLIGTQADHRFIVDAVTMHSVVTGLAAAVLHGMTAADAPPWLAGVAADLQSAHGCALVHAGPDLPPEAHALVHAVNEALGARGATLEVIDSVEHQPAAPPGSLAGLINDMAAGRVSALLILDGNPAFTAPGFADAMRGVATTFHLAPSLDETALAATWFVPEAHLFEAWGDARAHDGTASIIQPMALPLYGGTTALDLLSLLRGPESDAPLDAVRRQWHDRLGDDRSWGEALAAGVIAGTASQPSDARLRPEAASAAPPPPAPVAIELLFRTDPYLRDGRNANNAWLQELPRPHSKLVWDNPLLISPALGKAHGLSNGDEVELGVGPQNRKAPVWIVPGQAAAVAIATLGYGRRTVGEVGRDAGIDFFPLQGEQARAGAVTLRRTGLNVLVACTDHHNALDVKPEDTDPIVRHGLLEEFRRRPDFLKGEAHGETLYEQKPQGPVAWGMSVDLNSCIGCNSCVVACMSENNVPVVGRQQVIHQREMHWLRIDRYYEGEAEDPGAFFQPMLCHHCEEAPCEVVCPVGATVHDSEGLNAMVYNRCVGTRFCSNNCPYKVRRFNYFDYARKEHRPEPARNPDVSVRSRGVMEKCTFCVQRIAEARIEHDVNGTPERVQTACQAACPTRAFSFGDLNDPDSEVRRRKHSPLDYVLLPEKNTRPRLTYEGRITNPNSALSA